MFSEVIFCSPGILISEEPKSQKIDLSSDLLPNSLKFNNTQRPLIFTRVLIWVSHTNPSYIQKQPSNDIIKKIWTFQYFRVCDLHCANPSWNWVWKCSLSLTSDALNANKIVLCQANLGYEGKALAGVSCETGGVFNQKFNHLQLCYVTNVLQLAIYLFASLLIYHNSKNGHSLASWD